ncbi:MAG: gliding motility-associated C-terminal domain-containing protein [Bacteroidota bacterium]
MKNFFLPLLAAVLFCLPAFSQNPYISRPEIVTASGGAAYFCQGESFQVKFDAEGMNDPNVFNVELSDQNGNFAAPTIIGSVPGGNTQNQYATCTVPLGQTPGNGYRIRIKSSNPSGTYSVQNNVAITINGARTVVSAQPNRFGQNNWVAHCYTWAPTGPGTIGNGNTQNIFPTNSYKGYFVIDSLNFNYNWDYAPMPGVFSGDSNFVRCSYTENYSIRFRRRQTFAPGFYNFLVGADDGIRLSIDGGQTWIIDGYTEQPYTEYSANNGCGTELSGPVDLVVEFWQRLRQSHARVRITATGNPAENPVFAPGQNEMTLCRNSDPVQLVASPAGGTFTGNGVTPGGLFTASRVQGSNAVGITYRTGTSNCVKQSSIIIRLSDGSNAAFTMPDTAFCQTAGPVTVTAADGGFGKLSGPGVVTDSLKFDPALAGPGFHNLRYISSQIAGCPDTVFKKVHVYPAAPAVAVNPLRLETTFCNDNAAISLVPYFSPAGGTFTGPGVRNGLLSPAGLTGNPKVFYHIGQGPCRDSTSLNFTVIPRGDAEFSGLDSAYCSGGQPVRLQPLQPGGTFSGIGIIGNTFLPSTVPPTGEQVEITYIVAGGQNACFDTVKKYVRVYQSLQNIQLNTPATVCSNSGIYRLEASLKGGTFSGPGVTDNNFNPAGLGGNVSVKYRIGSGVCTDSAVSVILVRRAPVVSLSEVDTVLCLSEAPAAMKITPSGGLLTGPGLVNGLIDPVLAGIGRHSYFYKYTNPEGCSDSATITVHVYTNPAFSVQNDTSVCYGEPANFSAALSNGNSDDYVFSWEDPKANILYTGRQISPVIPNSTGLNLRVTHRQSACYTSFTGGTAPGQPGWVSVNESFNLVMKIDTVSGSASSFPLTVKLVNQSTLVRNNAAADENSGIMFLVNWGDGNSIQTPGFSGLQHTYDRQGNELSHKYTISTTAWDNSRGINGACIKSSADSFTVWHDNITNIITPNADGYNDALVFPRLADQSRLIVISRWGKEVYSSNAYDNSFTAAGLPGGVYYYILEGNGQKAHGAFTVQK